MRSFVFGQRTARVVAAARAVRARLVATGVAAGLVLTVAGTGVSPAASAEPEESGVPRVERGVAPDAAVRDGRPGAAFADPQIARLQRTASRVRSELAALDGKVRAARSEVRRATTELDRARAERRAADAAVAARQDEVDAYSNAVFGALGTPNEIRLFLTAADQRDWLRGSEMIATIRADQNRRLAAALSRQRSARAAEQAAAEAERTARNRRATLRQRTDDARNRADAVSAELRGELNEADAAVTRMQQAQARRNRETAGNWQDYLARLDAAGITPPPAARLRNPENLPPGLRPVRGADGRPQAGVARHPGQDGSDVLVLPEETVDAVSAAVDVLGRPYVPAGEGGRGPLAYSCAGLTSAAYESGGVNLPGTARRQMATGRPVPRAEIQPGDLVFVGPRRYGVQSVGIVLDGRTMLSADARKASVVVSDLPGTETTVGFARPSLGTREPVAVPRRNADELAWRCGGVRLSRAGQDAAAGPWGGYPNGLIPPASLCPIGTGAHLLRCDAAQAYRAMSAAFAEAFGRPLCITDSYRRFDQQVDLYARKPALAAVPGTSNHGWALAVDLCGGVHRFGTPQHQWMRAHAAAFGWSHPGWARQGSGKPEPWHWEYVGTSG